MTKLTKIFLVLSFLYTIHAFASPTVCDLSPQAVTSAFGKGFDHATSNSDVFEDLGLSLPQVRSILMQNWGACALDLNVAYGAIIRRACSRPACISKYLMAGKG